MCYDMRTVLWPIKDFAGKRRIMDLLYGPQAVEMRLAIICRLFEDFAIFKNDKRVQWGNFRKALYAAAGVDGECEAERESQMNTVFCATFA